MWHITPNNELWERELRANNMEINEFMHAPLRFAFIGSSPMLKELEFSIIWPSLFIQKLAYHMPILEWSSSSIN